MKLYLIFISIVLWGSFLSIFGQTQSHKTTIDNLITTWHKAAEDADFKSYSDLMATDMVFIGTDPTEYWKGEAFLNFAKPYFDRGKAWSFNTINRQIYRHDNSQVAWFDELLDTQMGICRGSGVLIKTKKGWKIKHYVLSISIPNENVDEIKAIKKDFETRFMTDQIDKKE